MFNPGLSDLDSLVLRCRNGKAKSYLAEAVACLKAGAFRAAIVVTWVAVVHDVLAKLDELAHGGDANAQRRLDEFHRAVATADLKASLDFERCLLEVSRDEFELFGALAYTDLSRLREDRNRCAHPSMLDPATDYQPIPELARCHVVNAVSHLLEHGPAQGKAAMDRLLAELEQTYFPITVDDVVVHLENGPLGRPRASLVRNFVVVLLKRALPRWPVLEFIDWIRVSSDYQRMMERARVTLQAVICMHREAALSATQEKLDGLITGVQDERLADALHLFGAIPELWHLLSLAQVNRLSRYVQGMPVESAQGWPYESIPQALAAAWRVAALQGAVAARLSGLSSKSWARLAQAGDMPAEWMDYAVVRLRAATSWDEANAVAGFLVAHVNLVSEAQLSAVLDAAAATPAGKLRTSFGVRDLVWASAYAGRLGPGRVAELIATRGLTAEYSAAPSWWPPGTPLALPS